MVKATKWLTEAEKKEIENTIASAENKTRCEFVCAVASRSSAYDRAKNWWSLLGAVVGLFTAGTVSHLGQEVGDWEHLHSASLFPSLAGVILGFLLGRIAANHISGLLLMFVNEAQRAQAVERSAAYLFGKHKVSYTQERVGVLIYISLFERQLVVFADRAVAEALGAEGLTKLTDLGKKLLAKGERAKAVVQTIEAAAAELEEKFPGQADDTNELTDAVVEIHPWP